jgi:hypothetical protein
LIATWTIVIPAASTISAERNTGNSAKLAAGMNPSAPSAITISPITIVFL